jgi:hypothetical protein
MNESTMNDKIPQIPVPQPSISVGHPALGPDLDEAALAPRYRTSTVARLPKTVRDNLNQMLLDGVPYKEIIARLGDDGKNLNEHILHRWSVGGYRDWLRAEQRREDFRTCCELTLDHVASHSPAEIHQAALQIAAVHISNLLRLSGHQLLRATVTENPAHVLKLMDTLPRLAAGSLRCELQAAQAAAHADRDADDDDDPVEKANRGLRPETLAKIKAQLDLM